MLELGFTFNEELRRATLKASGIHGRLIGHHHYKTELPKIPMLEVGLGDCSDCSVAGAGLALWGAGDNGKKWERATNWDGGKMRSIAEPLDVELWNDFLEPFRINAMQF